MREALPNAGSGLQAPPAFLERPKEEYFQEVGRDLLIPCSARGDPPPTVSWAKVRLRSCVAVPCRRVPALRAPGHRVGRRTGEGKGSQTQGGEEAGAAGERRGARGEGWLRVSSGLTSGSVGGPGAAGPGPGGQQQQPHPATTDQGGPWALGVHRQQCRRPRGHLHERLRAGSVAAQPAGAARNHVGRETGNRS